jgi:sulfite exporter TauE/SafE
MNADAVPRDIARLREDLTILEEAAGLGFPFGREAVRFWLVIAAGSALVLLATVFASVVWQLAALGTAAVAGAGLLLGMLAHLRKVVVDRRQDPARWREYRYITHVKLALVPCLLAYFAWILSIGAPLRFAASALVFMGAAACLAYGLSSPPRRFAIGIAFPGMILAGLLPVVPWTHLPAVTAACALTLSLAAAGVLSWQLRRLA